MGVSQQADDGKVVVLGEKEQSSYLDDSFPIIKLKGKSDESLEMGKLRAFRLWLRNHRREGEAGSGDEDSSAK